VRACLREGVRVHVCVHVCVFIGVCFCVHAHLCVCEREGDCEGVCVQVSLCTWQGIFDPYPEMTNLRECVRVQCVCVYPSVFLCGVSV